MGRVLAPFQADAARLSRSCRLLLAYLLLRRNRAHAREVVAGTFWGDIPEPFARRRLNTTVWRLRRALEPDARSRGSFIVAGQRGELAFNRESAYWLDVDEFETLATPLVAKPVHELGVVDLAALERAVALYEGDLLEGEYDEWVLSDRARLANLHLKGLLRLIDGYRRTGEHRKAIDYATLVLEREPLREDVHRQLMALYALDGRRAEALRHFERCGLLLRRELRIEPMPETVQLAARIAGGHEIPEQPAQLDSRDVLGALEESCGEMERLLQAISHSVATLRLELRN